MCFANFVQAKCKSDKVIKATTTKFWRSYLNEWPQDDQNRTLLTLGSKVGQRVLIAIKPKTDVWHRLLDVYTTFQIAIGNQKKT